LSVNKITKRGYILLFDDKQCQAFGKSDVKIIGSCKFTASNVDGVYKLDQNVGSSSVAVEESAAIASKHEGLVAMILTAVTQEVWYKRVGHLSLRGMLMLRDNIAYGVNFQD
jgi:hypothetical protein